MRSLVSDLVMRTWRVRMYLDGTLMNPAVEMPSEWVPEVPA